MSDIETEEMRTIRRDMINNLVAKVPTASMSSP
jgi:hypothetical protein